MSFYYFSFIMSCPFDCEWVCVGPPNSVCSSGRFIDLVLELHHGGQLVREYRNRGMREPDRRVEVFHRYDGGSVEVLDLGACTVRRRVLDPDWLVHRVSEVAGYLPLRGRVFYFPRTRAGEDREMKEIRTYDDTDDIVAQCAEGPTPIFLKTVSPLDLAAYRLV